MKFLPVFVLSLLITTSTALGHEFWLAPANYQVPKNDNIVASLRGGQKFVGGPFSFLPQRFVRFDLVQGDSVVPVEGRIGDRPAVNMAPPGDGLWVLVHETTDNKLTWDEWEKFAAFVNHKKLGNALQEHADRGLPETGFRESYRRFIKSLVAVGNGAGADREVGLRTEFVALANPYTDDISDGFPVQVLFEGIPRVNAQIEIFAKDEAGEVAISTVQTDDEGRAMIPVLPGREYLLDAVILLPLESTDTENDPVWESLWAAMTFRAPG
jgi:uncharacterized GH25 family protein